MCSVMEEEKNRYTEKGNFVILYLLFVFVSMFVICHCTYKDSVSEGPCHLQARLEKQTNFDYRFCLVMCFGLFTQNYN